MSALFMNGAKRTSEANFSTSPAIAPSMAQNVLLPTRPNFSVLAAMNPDRNVRSVYEWPEKNERGEFQYVTGHSPVDGAKRFAAYTAELFRLGSDEPRSECPLCL